ncbi:AAA family ATPase [Sphingobium sp.]|uniref:AAA family ATPase n=1 Tax=Sphingobium sp. TaxID=1912891 RepID=UPI002B67685D|nr:AAA family ATPase [Sphingobium sp.]HUD95827.1 AAA family ATPase [Sphingobium sp.]
MVEARRHLAREKRVVGARRSGLRDFWIAARTFFRHPSMVGSSFPASQRMVSRMFRSVDWNAINLMVEFGPGTGAFTATALGYLRPDATLLAIDTSSDFTQHLRRTLGGDSRLIVVTGSASDLDAILAARGINHIDCILSGLPFSTLSEAEARRIVDASARLLRPSGSFLAYQMRTAIRPYLVARFDTVMHDFEWWNLPPCHLYRACLNASGVLLRANGMQPRHRVLLSGPPRNGKTSVAEAVAEALAVQFFTVRYDALVGSYLGETNTRLARLFDYARTVPCDLFFDEFDSIGKERGDIHETGEIKRVVSFLLMQIDQLPSYVVTIAATNHAELLDRAVWRRFQLRLSLPQPSTEALAVFLQRQFDIWPEPAGTRASTVASRLGEISYAETLEFCQTVRRQHILSLGGRSIKDILKEQLDLWATRVGTNEVNAARSGKAAPSPE